MFRDVSECSCMFDVQLRNGVAGSCRGNRGSDDGMADGGLGLLDWKTRTEDDGN